MSAKNLSICEECDDLYCETCAQNLDSHYCSFECEDMARRKGIKTQMRSAILAKRA